MVLDSNKRRLIGLKVQTDGNLMPWVKSESALIDFCSRCGDCVEQCPEKIIEVNQTGLPMVNFELGECTFCKGCAEVCEQSVFEPTTSKPWQQVAIVQQNCLANDHVYCRSCAEACPEQALSFSVAINALPQIDINQCNGCGACVAPCPVNAINVEDNYVKQ